MDDSINIKKRERAKNWTDEEIESFLSIAIDKKLPFLSDGGKFRISDVYEDIRKTM